MLRFFEAYEQHPGEGVRDIGREAQQDQVGAVSYNSLHENAHLITDRTRIARRYLRFRFWLALGAAFPLDLFLLLGAPPTPTGCGSGSVLPPALLTPASAAAYAGLLRLCTVSQVELYFRKWEWSGVDHSIFDRLLKHVIVAAVGSHWLACGWIYIAHLNECNGLPSYLSSEREQRFFNAFGFGESQQYTRAIYWAFTTFSTVGYGDITPVSMSETIYASFTVVLGTSFFLYTVGTDRTFLS